MPGNYINFNKQGNKQPTNLLAGISNFANNPLYKGLGGNVGSASQRLLDGDQSSFGQFREVPTATETSWRTSLDGFNLGVPNVQTPQSQLMPNIPMGRTSNGQPETFGITDVGKSASNYNPFQSAPTALQANAPVQSFAPAMAGYKDDGAAAASIESFLQNPAGGYASGPKFDANDNPYEAFFSGVDGKQDYKGDLANAVESIYGSSNATAAPAQQGWWDKLTNGDGFSLDNIGSLVGVGGDLFNAFNNYGLLQTQQDNLDFQKDAFGLNYDAQRATTNGELATRQDTRMREANGANVLPTDQYLKQYGIASRTA